MPSEQVPPKNRANAWTDSLGRSPRDLRISVTDRCNFRCSYCMPRDKVAGNTFLKRAEVIDFEEITRVAELLVREGGVQKIRITGGEPLLRRQLPRLIAMLAPLGAELAMTTNGVLLPEHARSLRDAGLSRLTVSLDALDEGIFQQASDAPGFSAAQVLSGIAAAESAGFETIKVNCVVRRGVNESQILPLAQHFAQTPHSLRFIEFMDVGTRNEWDLSQVVTSAEIEQRLGALEGLAPVAPAYPGEVAERFRWGSFPGEIGLISSVSRPFCRDCCRLRLSADGKLHTCLFSTSGTDVLSSLRAGCSPQELESLIRGVWQRRSDRYSEERAAQSRHMQGEAGRRLPVIRPRVEMSYIGG